MDLMNIGKSLLTEQFSGSVSEEQAGSALSSLMGDGAGNLDISGLVAQVSGNVGLGALVSSWLGDGDNEGINSSQLLEMFGGEKISAFAQNLGLDQESATQGLSSVLPALIDKASAGGSLTDSVGGLRGVIDMVKKLDFTFRLRR